jgi:hypothetical protein
MSLYEQFHSDINKKYMFNMIKTIISKEFNKDIESDENYSSFISTLQDVFEGNNKEDITELNKVLLDSEVGKYRKMFRPGLEQQVVVSNTNKATTIEELLKQRDMPIIQEENQNEIELEEDKTEKKNVFSTSIENITKEINDFKGDNKDVSIDGENNECVSVSEENLKSKSINSSQRKNINSSRYNYIIDLEDNNINCEDLKYVSKMIIPIENNYMFSIPILILKIPELEIDIHLQQEDTIINNNGTYGVYVPLTKEKINVKGVNKISINIIDISETKFNSIDILKVNIVQIKDNKIGLTCSNINSLNFKIGDNIKVINNHTYDLSKLSRLPLKINNIIDNIIYCWLPEKIKNCSYDDSDMKLLNLSNQNIIFFNQ